MLFGWMTQSKLACLICMEDIKAITLKYGEKNSWFDYHRRFLDMDHTYRRGRYGFRKNTIGSKEAPIKRIVLFACE